MPKMRLALALEGRLAKEMEREAAALDPPIGRAVKRASRRVVLDFRQVVLRDLQRGAGFGRRGAKPRRIANSVRGLAFTKDGAAIVYSKFGLGKPGADRYLDFFAPFVFGATIRPRRAERLFIALDPRVRKMGKGARERLSEDKGVRIVPIDRSRALIVKETRTRSRPLALLVKQVRIEPRLDFEPVYRRAERILPEELAVELSRAS